MTAQRDEGSHASTIPQGLMSASPTPWTRAGRGDSLNAVAMRRKNPDGKPWWQRLVGLLGSVYAIAQAAGFPQSLFVWARCVYWGGDACAPFRQAINDMPSSLWRVDLWRLFDVALLIVCLMLLFGRPRVTIRRPSLQRSHDPRERTERELATADAQERLTMNINDLERLVTEGREIKPSRGTRWSGGDVSPAAPPVRLQYDGYEGDEWSGRVLVKLMAMNEKALEQYFQGCVEIRDAGDRLTCFIERLTRIITELRKRTT